jgi:hypothetical protein
VDDIQHPHHKTGLPLLDIAIGGAAILISLVSVAIGVHQGRVMERMLAASTMPYLVWATGNSSDDGKPQISFNVTNSGMGPAIVESLELTLNGQPIRDQRELAQAVGGKFDNSRSRLLEGSILGPKEEMTFLLVPQDGNTWGTLNKDRFKLGVKLCYCSVLDECWERDFAKPRPTPVQQCARDDAKRWFSLGVPAAK